MKDASSDTILKATAAAVFVYATAMGFAGLYWALQCGSHWFTYAVLSYLPYAGPGAVAIYFALIWLQSQYGIGDKRHWVLACAISIGFFIVCFLFAHLQPELQPYNGNDCQPF